MQLRLVSFTVFILLSNLQASAMKPGPFEDIHYKDPKTHFLVDSILDKKRGQFSSEGYTIVYNDKKHELWRSTNLFVGRRQIQLSPDGMTLALIGSFEFGGSLQLSPDEVLVDVIKQGQVIKSIIFSDIYKGDLSTLTQKFNISEEGGGWVSLNDLLKEVRIDWKKKNIFIKFVDGKDYTFPFDQAQP